jgi:hypothetical protein
MRNVRGLWLVRTNRFDPIFVPVSRRAAASESSPLAGEIVSLAGHGRCLWLVRLPPGSIGGSEVTSDSCRQVKSYNHAVENNSLSLPTRGLSPVPCLFGLLRTRLHPQAACTSACSISSLISSSSRCCEPHSRPRPGNNLGNKRVRPGIYPFTEVPSSHPWVPTVRAGKRHWLPHW